MNPGKTVADLEAAIEAEIERVKAGPIEDWEIEKARNNARNQLVNSLGSALDRAITLGEDALFYNNPDRINTRADSIAKVTAADVQRVAKQYLVKTGRTVVITVPKAAAGERRPVMQTVMRTRTLLLVTAIAAGVATSVAGQMAPGGQGQPPSSAGLVIKGKAPVSNDVLKVKLPKPQSKPTCRTGCT